MSPRLFRLAAALALSWHCWGCATPRVWQWGTQPGPPKFDDLAKLEGAWSDERELIVAFSGWLERPARMRDLYRKPSGEPARWWLRVPTGEFREFGLDPARNQFSSFSPAPPQAILLVRGESLSEGVPPPEALAGKKPIATLDLRPLRYRARQPELKRQAARHREAVFAVWRSEEMSWSNRPILTLAHSIRPEGAPEAGMARVELEPVVPPPQPAALALLPFAVVFDAVAAPVSLVLDLFFGSGTIIVATSS
jgi:hypothetical protein